MGVLFSGVGSRLAHRRNDPTGAGREPFIPPPLPPARKPEAAAAAVAAAAVAAAATTTHTEERRWRGEIPSPGSGSRGGGGSTRGGTTGCTAGNEGGGLKGGRRGGRRSALLVVFTLELCKVAHMMVGLVVDSPSYGA